jgi:polyhydroxybutyrate depolymerase
MSIVVHPAVAVTAVSTDATLHTADGRDRTYHVFVPDDLAEGEPVPLLIALHGGTGWGMQFERNSGFDGLAQANGFIVVYPDGVGNGPNADQQRTWNGGACCGIAARTHVDDVAFVDQLITQLEADFPIDTNRVFAAGHSNGGILAYRLACELPDRIAAIGVQSSALEIDSCTPDRPVSAIHIHGAADQNLPIDGGVGPNALSGVSFNKPLDGATALAAADGCVPAPVTTGSSNADLIVRTWTPCAADTEVVFVEVAGAGHAWMGHATGGSGRVGPVYERLDSSLVIWNFLAQHVRI